MEQRQSFGWDYTAGLEEKQEETERTFEECIPFIRKILQRHSHIKQPHFVSPLAAAAFEDLIRDCDRMMEEFSGRWKATVDFENYEASIEMESVYFEFCADEFMNVLQKISARSIQVSLIPLTSDFTRIHILMPYFVPLEGGIPLQKEE